MIAALLVIGDKILSGRTKDKNIGYIAEYLTALGIDLREVRVVGDEETAIVDALNALRHRYTYVFTTGGIGPAPDDITSDCVAKAFGVPIDVDPRALAILHEWLKATGAEMSEARMRMTRIPKGADLVLRPSHVLVRFRKPAVSESRHRIPVASVGQPTEPCLSVISARPSWDSPPGTRPLLDIIGRSYDGVDYVCAVRESPTPLWISAAQNGHFVWPGFAPCGFSHVATANCRTFRT